MKAVFRRSVRGFSLIEVLAVLVIIGILLGVALPSYRSTVLKASRRDAQASLLAFAQAMERHYLRAFAYGSAALEGADTGAPAPGVFRGRSPAAGQPVYVLSIVETRADPPYYRLRATPLPGGSASLDGFIEIDSEGLRVWDRNNDGEISTSEQSW